MQLAISLFRGIYVLFLIANGIFLFGELAKSLIRACAYVEFFPVIIIIIMIIVSIGIGLILYFDIDI